MTGPVPDVLVVGGGSAGSVLAARLSERPTRSVLLVEAGPDSVVSPPGSVLDAGSLPGVHDDLVRRFPVALGRDALDAVVRGSIVRGAVLGGGSAVNGGYFVRGSSHDFDGWFGPDDDVWSASAVLSSFVRSEHDLDVVGRLHGSSGPIPVRRSPVHGDPVTSAFYEACASNGHRAEPDMNAWSAPGYGPVPRNVVDGVRINAAMAYLGPARERPNLSIRTDSRVRRVLVEAGRAVGVEVDGPDGPELLSAGHVVLCAGAVGSAQLLLLSGVGPADHLRDVGIEVLADAPGLGTRCSDHPAVELAFEPIERSDLGGGIVDGALHGELGNGDARSPYEVLAVRRSYGRATGDDPHDTTLHLRLSLMQPRSRGALRLISADPSDAPSIDLGHLSDPEDRSDMRALVRLGAELLGSMSHVVAETSATVAAGASDADVQRFVDSRMGTSMHLSGTVPMGGDDDPHAVTDRRCRVRGVEGLSVVDTAIMPRVTSRGPAATAIMLGEHAVQFFD